MNSVIIVLQVTVYPFLFYILKRVDKLNDAFLKHLEKEN